MKSRGEAWYSNRQTQSGICWYKLAGNMQRRKLSRSGNISKSKDTLPKQCLLSLKDTGDNSGGGEVYGFVTAGDS